MKQNDWLMASFNNPDFTPQDFKDVIGMNLQNTQFLSKEAYEKTPFVQKQKVFQDPNGKFSDAKFTRYYNTIASSFRDFSTEDSIDNYEYDLFDPNRPTNGRVRNPNFSITTVKNPDHYSIGVTGINQTSLSDKSRRELAQNSKIFDPKTGKFLDHSVNDISLFENPVAYISSLFDDPLVYATYDKDTVEIDPETGKKVVHKAGEWKVNDDGEYYTEKLNGRPLNNKTVVSVEDYVTSENSAINKYDFMDSDGLDKSATGTIVKNLVSVLPMLPLGIPYLQTAYSGLLVARELAKTLPMAYGMVTSLVSDEKPNNELMNTLAGFGQKFSSSTSDYAQEHTLALENIGNMMSDTALQWGQQKFIVDAYNKLTGGGQNILNTATAKAAGEYSKKSNQYLQEALEGKISKAQLSSYLGTDDPFNVEKLFENGKWTETALGKASLNKFMPAAEKAFQNRQQLAQNLSLVYMSLISNTDVYDSILEKGGTPREAAALAFGSSLGMFGVDRYLGLGEMFFEKDPAKLALRQSAKDTTNLFMKNAKKIENLDTKKGIINTINKGINLGKKIVNNFMDKYQNGNLNLMGKALGEGTEEMAEELVTDLTKNLGELAGKLGYFSQTDYGAWDNMGERYGMSFLGGSLGGALFGGIDAWNNRNNTQKKSQTELSYLLRQGKKDEILSEIRNIKDKGGLGSKDLSYDSTTDEDGNITYLTADEKHKSQAETNYEQLTRMVNQLDMILNDNQLHLTDDELFDKMVQGEYRANALTDFLKGDDVEKIKDVSYISRYQEDFQDLSNQIVDADNAIQQYINSVTDPSKRNNEKYKEKLEELRKKKEDLIKKKEYLFGEGSLGYVEKTLWAMDTKLSGQFVTINFNQFVREQTGKSVKQLTPTELSTLQEKYKEYSGNIKQNVDQGFKKYKEMQAQLEPELKKLSDLNFDELIKLRADDPANKTLTVNDKLDSETQEEFDSLFEKKENETEEEFQERRKKHEDAIKKHNIDSQFKWIQEYAKHPITTSDLRYFSAKVRALRQELLKAFLESTNKQGQKPLTLLFNGLDERLLSPLQELNKKLRELVLNKGIQDKEDLHKKINNLIAVEVSKAIGNIYPTMNYAMLQTPDNNSFFEKYRDEAFKKEKLGMNPDHKFNENVLTMYDFYQFVNMLKQEMPDDLDQNSTFSETGEETALDKTLNFLSISLTPEQKESYLQFEKLYKQNPEQFNNLIDGKDSNIPEEEAAIFLSLANLPLSYNPKVVAKLTKDYEENIGNTFNKSLDNFIDKVNTEQRIKTLNDLENAVITKNPLISLLNKISTFTEGTPEVETLLNNIYQNYKKHNTDGEFILTDSEKNQLKQILKNFEIAKIFIWGASSNTSNGLPVGHNKMMNQYVANHKDVFKEYKELPEIKDAAVLLGEIGAYEREINEWIEKSDINSGQRDIKFIKTKEVVQKTYLQFFNLNRKAFKINPRVDLLDGYDDLELDDSLSSLLKVRELLYNNYRKSGLSIEEVLDGLANNGLINAKYYLGQLSAELNEKLDYSKLTNVDNFQLVVSSLAVSNFEYYKHLKEFIEANKNIAPITSQEVPSFIVYAQNKNPELINKALNWIKKNSDSKLDVCENTTICRGVGGSGKTFGTTKFNLGEGENCWLSGPTQFQIDTLQKSLTKGEGKPLDELFKIMFGGNSPKLEDTYVKLNNKGNIALKDGVDLKQIQNPPKSLIIDEATHLSTAQILLISKWCKLNNINLLLLGDNHQSSNIDNDGNNILRSDFIGWFTPDLYLSLRNDNSLKTISQNGLIKIIDAGTRSNTIEQAPELLKKVQFSYYNGDHFTGDFITKEVSNELLAKIPKDKTIGFIGDNTSKLYKQLKDAGFDVTDPMQIKQIQGREYDYVFTDITLNGNNPVAFSRDLYTIITRSRQGTILIDNGLSKFISQTEAQYDGGYSDFSKSIENFRKIRIPEIDKALEDCKDFYQEIKQHPTQQQTQQPAQQQTTQQPPQQATQQQTTENQNPEPENTDQQTTQQQNPPTQNNGATTIQIGTDVVTQEQLTQENNPEIKGDTEEETKDDKDESVDVETPKVDTPNLDDFFSCNLVTCFSNLHYSGINTSQDTWVNDNNSTTDLGILVKPSQKVTPGNKGVLITNLLKLKCIFTFDSLNRYDDLPQEIREIFSKENLENAKYFIRVEDINDSNRYIGATKSTGVENEKRGYNGKIIKIIVKIKGNDGVTYSLSLGALNSPDTWQINSLKIKEALKKENKPELQSIIDNYDDIINEYKNRVDSWCAKGEYEFQINPPKFTSYTYLRHMNSSYRLLSPDGKYSPYEKVSPIQITSQPEILLKPEEIPGIKPSMRGKPVMFVTSNLLLPPSQLKKIYMSQTQTGRKDVRMVCLNNVGVSFASLYQKQWKQIYTIIKNGAKLTTPMELKPFAIRSYIAMWNYRAGLGRFLERYNQFKQDNNLTDDQVRDICKQDRIYFEEARSDSKELSESNYRNWVQNNQNISQNVKDQLQLIWNFNDSDTVTSYVREFRLGYAQKHGAYLRKLTKTDEKFYKDTSNVVGIYIDPEIANTQYKAIDKLFDVLIDKLISPISDNKKVYVTTKLKDLTTYEDSGTKNTWVDKLKETGRIEIDFTDGTKEDSGQITVDKLSKLEAMPILLIKAAHYLNIGSNYELGLNVFLNKDNNPDKETTPYVINYKSDTNGNDESFRIEYEDILKQIDQDGAPNDENIGTVIEDLFNLMFHGVVSIEKENDFEQPFIRASFAEFKYGIFSDPVLIERKNKSDDNISDYSATKSNFFKTDMVASGSYFKININEFNPETAKKKVKKETKSSKPALNQIDEVIKLHNEMTEKLGEAFTEGLEDSSSKEEYIKSLQNRFNKNKFKMLQKIKSIEDIDRTPIKIDDNGFIYTLKNLFDGYGEQNISKIKKTGKGLQITFDNGNVYNLQYQNSGNLSIKLIDGENTNFVKSKQYTAKILNPTQEQKAQETKISNIEEESKPINEIKTIGDFANTPIIKEVLSELNDKRINNLVRNPNQALSKNSAKAIIKAIQTKLESKIDDSDESKENYLKSLYEQLDEFNNSSDSCFLK